jgi:DNA binding domain, excisionase family
MTGTSETKEIVQVLREFVQTILPSMVDSAIEKRDKVRPATLNMEEAAVYLGVHKDTVRKLVREKRIPHSRVAGRILLRTVSLDKMMDELEFESLQVRLNQDSA